ncbi:MAG: hypothetical protein ACYTG4_06060, partial [Planctomycetota bacterium]
MWRYSLALVLLLAAPAAAQENAAGPLLKGVKTIGAPGVPGPLAVTGDDAFAVVTGGKPRRAVVAVSRMGKGRVAVLGHGGYLKTGTHRAADTERLFLNVLHWCAAPVHRKEPPRVGVLNDAALATRLEKQHGLRSANLAGSGWATDLKVLDVLVADSHRLTNATTRETVRRFVQEGGGLVTAGLGWGWKQLNPGRDLATEHP